MILTYGKIKGMKKEICGVENREIAFEKQLYARMNLSEFGQYFTVVFITVYITGTLTVHIKFVVLTS
jgi:hypothetical protein